VIHDHERDDAFGGAVVVVLIGEATMRTQEDGRKHGGEGEIGRLLVGGGRGGSVCLGGE
jgi:hypothetical protein